MRPFAALLVALLCVPAVAGIPLERERWALHAGAGIDLQVVELGPADAGRPPVIVLHGGPGGSFESLLPLVAPLAAREHIVLFDQRGSLHSPAPLDAIGFDAMVEDIERLRVQLDAPRVTLLAHSMGSLLAYAYATTHPQRVERMLLVAPQFPLPATSLHRATGLPAPAPDVASLAQQRRQQRAQAAVAAERKRQHLPDTPRNDRERSQLARIDYAAWSIHDLSRWREVRFDAAIYNNRAVFRRWVESVGGTAAFNARWEGWWPALQALPAPVTFIVGEADMNADVASWQALVARLPRARLATIRDAGHMPWIDQPARVPAAMRLP